MTNEAYYCTQILIYGIYKPYKIPKEPSYHLCFARGNHLKTDKAWKI